MKQWITEVLIPHAEGRIAAHHLRTDSHIVLVLDAWAVHRGEDFRRFLRTDHPKIHLVFVPANCTSKLQVADVTLQRSFKSVIRNEFNKWAAGQMHSQIQDDEIVGLAQSFRMGVIKPLVLEWCIASWRELQDPTLITKGWHQCCVTLYDVHDESKRLDALHEGADRQLDVAFVPEDEAEADEPVVESDSDGEELDFALPRAEPTRVLPRRARNPPAAAAGSYMLSSQQIAMSGDSELE
jgi:hypothetical protein